MANVENGILLTMLPILVFGTIVPIIKGHLEWHHPTWRTAFVDILNVDINVYNKCMKLISCTKWHQTVENIRDIKFRCYLYFCIYLSRRIIHGLVQERRHSIANAQYSISQKLCTRFCCALLCCGYAIVHNEFTWRIYPYSSGLLCWHWGNR